MNTNLTEIVCILDMSGSMTPLTSDTLGGYNGFISSQKLMKGDAAVTTVLFDDRYILLHDHVNIRDVSDLTVKEYQPLGYTALMDAVGKTVQNVGQRLAATPENERPGKVIVVIITDGYENASKEYTREQVRQMIEHQQSKYSWEFLFIGAGIDAYKEASSLGVDAVHTAYATADALGTKTAYNSVTTAACSIRSSGALKDTAWKNGQTAESVNCTAQ